jgi:hypothetical protein
MRPPASWQRDDGERLKLWAVYTLAKIDEESHVGHFLAQSVE